MINSFDPSGKGGGSEWFAGFLRGVKTLHLWSVFPGVNEVLFSKKQYEQGGEASRCL